MAREVTVVDDGERERERPSDWGVDGRDLVSTFKNSTRRFSSVSYIGGASASVTRSVGLGREGQPGRGLGGSEWSRMVMYMISCMWNRGRNSLYTSRDIRAFVFSPEILTPTVNVIRERDISISSGKFWRARFIASYKEH